MAGIAAAGALLAAAGCAPCPERLLSLDKLVADYNANAEAVPRLWARVDLSVTLEVPDAPPLPWRSGGPTCLLLAKGASRLGPHDFVLIGRETAAVELFRIGSSTEQGVYYFWYQFGGRAQAWFGRHESAGAPGVQHLPIDPMQLLGVLCVCPLPDDATKLPAVALGMQNTPGDCAYVVTLIDRQPLTGRILFQREVFFRWSETEPPRPYKVHLFDPAGRRIMTAHLGDYRPIDVSALDEAPAVKPIMPTDIRIVAHRFAGVPTLVRQIHLVLSEMTAADKWERSACDFGPPEAAVPVQVDGPASPAAGPKAKEGARK
jgi:hypothetical protein